MPTMISGVASLKDVLSSRRVVDMSKAIAYLDPKEAPLTVLLKRIGKKRQVFNPKFDSLEDDRRPLWDAVNGAKTAADTTITVDNGSYFRVADLVKVVTTGEVLRVTAVNGNDLTVTRSWGSTVAGAIADNAPLRIIGNAVAEGSATSVESLLTQVTTQTNYIQKFENSVKVTKTAADSEMYGGNYRLVQRKKIGIEHKIDIESAFWFGEKNLDTSGSTPIRSTAGILERITTNVTDAGGTLTETEFETWCRTLFRYGSSEKFAFCSPLGLSIINSWGSAKVRLNPNSKKYGLNIVDYVSPFGTLHLTQVKLFENSPVGSGEGYGNMIAGLDMNNIYYVYFRGWDTKLLQNIQNPEADYYLDKYLTRCAVDVVQEKTHAVLNNIG